MIIFFIVYLSTITIVFIIINKKKNKIFPIPKIYFCGDKICFNTNHRHQICVGECSLLVVKNKAYLKRLNKRICLCNVEDVKLKNQMLTFVGLGTVEIEIGKSNVNKYLQMNISSYDFDLTSLKREAELEIVNNLFDLTACESLKRYLRFVKRILNININNSKIEVKQNVYNFAFCVDYEFNGNKKRIMFN